jgi:hypothetical protein
MLRPIATLFIGLICSPDTVLMSKYDPYWEFEDLLTSKLIA